MQVLSILECFNQGRTSDEGNLQPTTDELFKLVERFRVLVIGKSGVGKSSIINKCFGVKDATVAHSEAGVSVRAVKWVHH
ncbi:uncharacterized protein LACBIDRAFT_312662 [Laccaria bicolor S238N-H82]|uniref:Predicted protein n=1 Tax=Laccaria bicolor (strain S238N-H82 / ATCC MYA-4686) TaxID=486041 RepID=B0DWK6_LACBS|nr:uncharacterized protein LACBIDRAFT_312662 [Laccaria bicolor S238N-H82]EDR01063.1 predicted protein [Laccaria bicolor S238N-H82]|eukprot:XP_001888282.1 predicted protein [Laccaria bicolor S238N-H82]